MEKILCPGCGEVVCPQPNGTTNEYGEWEYEFTDCPIAECGHVFTADELKCVV